MQVNWCPIHQQGPWMDLLAKAVTLKSIRLHDKEAKELLYSAKHAVLYKFTKETGWTKTDTEGCLAVYLSAQQPVLIILNRLQPENFTCSFAQVGEVEVQGELLMFKLGTEIMGIWLFDAKELQALAQLISNQRSTVISSSSTMKSISLSDLLSQAVNKKEAVAISLEERLRTEFAGHGFVDLKDFARAVARFITLDPSTVAGLFEELRK